MTNSTAKRGMFWKVHCYSFWEVSHRVAHATGLAPSRHHGDDWPYCRPKRLTKSCNAAPTRGEDLHDGTRGAHANFVNIRWTSSRGYPDSAASSGFSRQ